MQGSTKVSGIVSRYEGECPVCGQPYHVGDIIDRVPGTEKARGHINCVTNPQPQRQPEPYAERGRQNLPDQARAATARTAMLNKMRDAFYDAAEAIDDFLKFEQGRAQ